MGRKSRRKKERRKNKEPIPPTSAGYFGMGLLGFVVGLLPGIAFGETVLVWLGSGLLAMVFFLAINRILLFFGFGPNSGSTTLGTSSTDDLIEGASSTSGSGVSGGAGGGGGGSAG